MNFKLKKKRASDEDLVFVSDKEKKRYIKSLNLDQESLKEIRKRGGFFEKKKNKKSIVQETVTYKSNFYAKMSNFFVENLSFYLSSKFDHFFKPLYRALTSSNLRVLSKTYISMILFSGIMALPVSFLISFILLGNVLLSIFISLMISFFVSIIVYSYPFIVSNDRKSKIAQELVFAEVHMAAIAGSGSQPVKIFQLLVDSGEYPTLQEELKRVLNYINFFGYSLSNSLRVVAKTTPSPELKELFNGMVSSISTGGDIRQYLSDKSEDTLTKYRFSEQKHLESIATYSEVYTGFLVAGPLLFIVTLAILEKISSDLAGIPIPTIATLGTFVLLPFLNVLFILFLETMRSEV